MEFSIEERTKLIEMKEEIPKITEKIQSNLYNEKNGLSIINDVNKIQSILTIISSYSKIKSHNLAKFNNATQYLILRIHIATQHNIWDFGVESLILIWCSAVNAMEFDFNKQNIIKLPIDINKIISDITTLGRDFKDFIKELPKEGFK